LSAAVLAPPAASAPLAVYADGGVVRGRAGAYWSVAVRGPAGLEVIARREDARFRTSMEAECAALAEALRHVVGLPPQQVNLFTDCRGLVHSLRRGRPLRTSRRALTRLQAEIVALIAELRRAGHRLSVQWMPREEIVLILGH
jgi:ribonuclease HI